MPPAADGGCRISPTCTGEQFLATRMALLLGVTLTQLERTTCGLGAWKCVHRPVKTFPWLGSWSTTRQAPLLRWATP
eukprot:10645776-Alexandrium_andersonii.AAC.1